MKMTKVLIVDDEESIQSLVDFHFKRAGFETEVIADGQEACERILANPHDVDLVILDLMLPGMYGMDVCRRVREAQVSTPIILVTAHDDDIERILGLEMWVDDYVTKPFSPRELVARAKAVLRRTKLESSEEKPPSAVQPVESLECFQVGDLVMDVSGHEVTIRGEHVEMTPKEFELLHLFLMNKNRVMTRDQLLNNVWGRALAESRVVDVHISNLREKIERDPKSPDYLQTVRGLGYKFITPNS